MYSRNYYFLIGSLFLFSFILSCNNTEKEGQKTGTIARQGMVVSAHPLASEVGLNILKKGGNAIDAAIATQFALAVVFPWGGNIGGGGFMVIRLHDGTVNTLDFREIAPLAAHKDMYLDSSGNIIENLSTLGHLASGVPGTVDGMVRAHEKYGSLEWGLLVEPSINLALEGFPLTEREANSLNKQQEDLKKYNTILPEHLLHAWEPGDSIRHTDLGMTLRRIKNKKAAGFYDGKTSSDILEEMQRGGGIITREDLMQYESKWREPIATSYKEYKIISMGPPSSGGIALTQLLNGIENQPIKSWGWNSVESTHYMTETERRVYADRATYLGDMDFTTVPIHTLTSKSHTKERMETYDPGKATPSEKVSAGSIPGHESEETTHFSIVDRFGNAVSVTTTINGGYGSKVVVAGSGFFLNNEMDDFSVKPGHPNMYGLLGGQANEIAPGKRMLSAMTPTIIEKNGKLHMVVGTPGGSTIITSVFQVIVNVIEHGFSMQKAVDVPRFHSQWFPDVIHYENNSFAQPGLTALEQMGHVLEERGPIGRVDAILVREDGTLEGGADHRGDDTAMGY